MLLFVAALSLFTAFKWTQFGYTGLDVAIYTQAMEETLRGRFMGLTIHPHSYFGDHVEPILLLIFPLYALIPSALTLLTLQTLALASGAIPVYLLARRRFAAGGLPLWAVGAYLIHPFILNPAAYEFHALTLAIPLLLWTLLAYEQGRWRLFLGLLGLTLLVREDVGIAAFGLGLLAFVDRRTWRWRLVPAILGIVWLAATMKIAGGLNQEGYKFLRYYGWLGSSVSSIVLNALANPWLVVQRLFGPRNFLGLIGLGLPFAFLPLLSPRKLVAMLPALIQLLLNGLSENAMKIHYTALLTPFLLVAGLDGLKRIAEATSGRFLPVLRRERTLSLLVLGVILIASSVIIGPVGALALDARERKLPPAEDSRLGWALLQTLPRPARAVASFRPITPLARSPSLYSLSYIFLGHRQYTKAPYPVGDDVEVVIIDDRDLLTIHEVYPDDEQETFREGFGRLTTFLAERQFTLDQQVGHWLVYRRDGRGFAPPVIDTKTQSLDSSLTLTGVEQPTVEAITVGRSAFSFLSFGLRFRAEGRVGASRQLKVSVSDDAGLIQREFYALNPLHPTSTWVSGEEAFWRYRPVLARTPRGRLRVQIEVMRLKGGAGLNGLRTVAPIYETIKRVGSPIDLEQVAAGDSRPNEIQRSGTTR